MTLTPHPGIDAESFVVVLRWPDAALHHNHRGLTVRRGRGKVWSAKGDAVRSARSMAHAEAVAVLGGQAPPRWSEFMVSLHFGPKPPDRKGKCPDGKNLDEACKAYIDGLQDAGIMANDSGMRAWGGCWDITVQPGMVRIVVQNCFT